MPRVAYRMLTRPGGGFHLGREGLAQETSADSFPSDSLFAALVAATVEFYGADAAAQFVADVTKHDALRLSSAFPILGELPLLPLPRLQVNLDFEGRTDNVGKRLKKISYVSPDILNLILRNVKMDDWLPSNAEEVNNGLLLNGGAVWMTVAERDLLPEITTPNGTGKYWTTGTVPRVTVDRVSNASNVYQTGRTVFADGCGLWFVAEVADAYADTLDVLVHLLGDSGIGGERSSGYGTFTPEQIPAPDLPPAHTARAMTLGRYHPTRTELEAGVLGAGASYELVDVGGWLGATVHAAQRRQRVRMIEAGSVLDTTNGVPVGQIRDVRPVYPTEPAPFPHPIYRSGISLFIGVPEGS
jgi:CRISPR-associated protein Csm4